MRSPIRRFFNIFVTGALAALPLAATVLIFVWAARLTAQYVGPGSLVGRVLSSIGLGVGASEVAAYAIGVAIVLALPGLWLAATQEFPDKAALLAACIAAPALFEAAQLLRYGGSVWDKIADTAFMVLPPVGAVLSFDWQGGLMVSGNLAPALWCLAATALIGAVGAWRRA